MSQAAIKTLERQALEALRQAAEEGATEGVRKSTIETALACMRAVARLQPPPKPRRRRQSS
jgi:hypothetical protein